MADGGDLLLHLMRLREAYGNDVLLPRGAPWSPPATASPPAAADASGAASESAAAPSSGTAPAEPRPALPIARGQPEGPREGSPTNGKGPAPAPPTPPADAATALEGLAAEVARCERCDLCKTRNHTVFGEGAADAEVMFIGEAPGANEDRQGRPFCGRAGELLDRIIENAMGLQRSEVYIANVNKCRPPGNRDPEPDEVAACLPFLRKQIEWIRPKVIVTLGRIAAHNLLGTTAPMRALRGRDLERHGVPVVATWHPAYLLRQPAAKRDTWEDVKRVNRLLGRPEVPQRPGGPRS